MIELKEFLFEMYDEYEDDEYQETVIQQYGNFELFEKEFFLNLSDHLKFEKPNWEIKTKSDHLYIKSKNNQVISTFRLFPSTRGEGLVTFKAFSFGNTKNVDGFSSRETEKEERVRLTSMEEAIKTASALIKASRYILVEKYKYLIDESSNKGLMIGDQEQSVTGAPNFTKLQMWGNAQGALPREDNPKMSIKRRLFGSNQNDNDEVNPSLQKNESIDKTEKHPYGDPLDIVDNIMNQIYGIFENDELDEEWELSGDTSSKNKYMPYGFYRILTFKTVEEPIINLFMKVEYMHESKKIALKYVFQYAEEKEPITKGGIGFIKIESFEEGLIPQDILKRLIGSMNQKFQDLMNKIQTSLL